MVVCPRVTDAALVVGPAAWWWDWAVTDWDRLAGAVAAGHVIECGPQATGGNFSFFTELGDRPGQAPSRPLGFPIAEVDEDGSSVITKHPGTGGRVTVETVTAQLLYEIGAPAYLNPDVVARFDTSVLAEEAPDRVRISGTRGEPAPPTTKVAINYEGGFRNRMTFVLTGLDQEAKSAWLTSPRWWTGWAAPMPWPTGASRSTCGSCRSTPAAPTRSGPAGCSTSPRRDPTTGRSAVRSRPRRSSWPSATSPASSPRRRPVPAAAYGVYWPALVPVDEVAHTVVLADGRRLEIEPSPTGPGPAEPIALPTIDAAPLEVTPGEPLGRWFGARSGDKGGNANVGIWARDDAGYAWLAEHLTVDRVRELLPEIRRSPDPPLRTPQPAGPQLRARRLSRRGRRLVDLVRPPGQGPRRVPPLPPRLNQPFLHVGIGPIRADPSVQFGEQPGQCRLFERHEVGPVGHRVGEILHRQQPGVTSALDR